jgi:hypothetical protein
MKENGRTTEVSWAPRRDSYEEAVLNWYEQVESSFRRRRLETPRARAEDTERRREAVVTTGPAVFD